MIVTSLELQNYRNYRELSIELSPGTNILYGNNAQGKTNILESVYICATTKSHRGTRDKDIIKFYEEDAHIRMYMERNGVSHKIDMHLKKSKTKGVAIDGIPIHKSSELFGLVNVICFSPEDLSIIKNGPSERRRFIDMELCQLDKIYLYDISNYNKVVNQRNNLLKNTMGNSGLRDTLEVWDMQLVSYGQQVILKRQAFIEKLNEIVCDIHGRLTGNKEKMILKYEPSTRAEDFAVNLLKRQETDLRLKSTSVGPHRDDISFEIDGIDIRKFGSQGQQRTAALSLKLAEIELVKQMINDKPILLLDDVLSELDHVRQNYLLESIRNIQTIITCTGLDEFVNKRFSIDRVYKVTDGNIQLIEEVDG